MRERDNWKLAEAAISSCERVLLYGPPGTGKTTFALNAGDPDRAYKTTLHEEMSSTEMTGHFVPNGDKFAWHDGLAIRAWRNGSRLVLDEIDKGSGDVLTVSYAILDDPSVARLNLATGEEIRPKAGFTVVATMNGSPGDLPPALLDRFDAKIFIPVPHPDAYAKIPEQDREFVKSTIETEDRTKRLSMRQWLAFYKMCAVLDSTTASQIVFGQTAEEVMDSRLAATNV